MTTQTPAAAAAAANMDPQVRAQLLRAARGVRQAPATAVPMGIRYRTPAAPARPEPVDRRPLWMTMAPTGVLEEIAEAVPLPRATRRAAAVRPGAARSAPAETSTARPAAAKPVAARKPIPAPRVAEATGPRVLGSYDAFACLACGSRYGLPFLDHGCGPLTPVTVTITTTIAGEQA